MMIVLEVLGQDVPQLLFGEEEWPGYCMRRSGWAFGGLERVGGGRGQRIDQRNTFEPLMLGGFGDLIGT